ncbi:MAG TPA: hypothetical protein PLZ95_13630 [Bryobacteraceae bacterium]|nr:hypothetical protein [Bryobacteraceae bacterium]
METIRVHTNFTNTVQIVHNIRLDDLLEPQTRSLLKSAFTSPEALRPGITREALTAEAAKKLGTLAETLRDRHHHPHAVAHFITRILFCLFAEDIGLLPERLFTRLLENTRNRPEPLALFSMTWREPGFYVLEARMGSPRLHSKSPTSPKTLLADADMVCRGAVTIVPPALV